MADADVAQKGVTRVRRKPGGWDGINGSGGKDMAAGGEEGFQGGG